MAACSQTCVKKCGTTGLSRNQTDEVQVEAHWEQGGANGTDVRQIRGDRKWQDTRNPQTKKKKQQITTLFACSRRHWRGWEVEIGLSFSLTLRASCSAVVWRCVLLSPRHRAASVLRRRLRHFVTNNTSYQYQQSNPETGSNRTV